MKSKFIKSILFSTIGVLSVSATTPISLSSCRKKAVQVTGVTLDKDKLELVQGKKTQLKATILPKNATNKNVTWSSSDSSTASVDQNGNVIAKNLGTATITVTTDDGGYTATCDVTVKEYIPVAGVTLDKDKLELAQGTTAQLKATVSPKNATNKNVTWSSNNESITTVDQNGNVKAISEGTATITVTTDDGGYKDFCDVIVTNNVSVTGVTLDKDKLELVEGETAQLIATVLPENATNKKVIWSSTNESAAIVDQDGNVKAVNEASTLISVTTDDGGYIAICLVNVTKKIIPVTGVTLDKDKLELAKGGIGQLTATVLPEDATNKKVTWKSNDTSVATVDQNGNITAKSAGNTTVTVTTEDGSKIDTCEVTVTENTIPVTGVTLDKDKLELAKGGTGQLTAYVLPENATNKNVTWSSSDPSIATVDQNGNVTAKTAGNVTITVTTDDGGYRASCDVTVKEYIPVKSVTIDKYDLKIIEGETAQLIATVLPENATNKNVTWRSNDTSIASVDQNGKVTAVGEGLAMIYATTEDGNKEAGCFTYVIAKTHVTGVTLNETKLELVEGGTAQLTATVLPENATNKNVTWKSFDTSLVTVDQNGNVTAKNPGSGAVGLTTVTVTTEDGGYEASCTVIVRGKVPVQSITLNETRLELNEGETKKLTATVLPENATNKKVTWKSNDESVATVDQNGNVKGISPGTVDIVVTTEDGGYEASCTVIVWERGSKPVVVNLDGYGIFTWGNITVKCKLISNNYGDREAVLLSKFDGDDENGYVAGAGVLRIPDHVVWSSQNYYVKRIPSEWSDGENDVNGIEFESNVSHLREICDYAFKGTNALDNYYYKILEFPEGLEYIGTEAFYDVNRSNDLIMDGIVFPSTLNAINVRAFANAGLIGSATWPATLTFKNPDFDPNNIKEKAFSPYGYLTTNYVQYIYAPTIELAARIKQYIFDHFVWDDFESDGNNLIPKVIGS